MSHLQQAAAAGMILLMMVTPGCVSVKAPERINIGHERHRRGSVDTRSIPETSSHEDARRKLGEAYAEIDYLRDKNRDLEKDKRELKRELDGCEHRMDRLEDRYDD